jgi:tetratricopeptide (TPR) repeat protein
MVRRYGWPLWLLAFTIGAALAVAPSVAAQTSGTVRGQVVDANGQPVEGATVTITGEATGRKYQSRTNRRGEFIQIGLTVGPYVLVAEKDKLASEPAKAAVRNAAPATVNLLLGAAPSAAASAAASKESSLFGEGVALSSAGKHAEAIEKFTAGIAANPACVECYNNIGYSYAQTKEYDKAEEAYKKAAELKPDNSTAWNGLANIYNAQRKFDLAVEASKKATDLSGGASGAAGGGNADAMYNQGVILWNGGKVADAKKQFEAAIQADPSHAEAHYQLGMALVNEGNLAGAGSEFETYLKLAPDGPNAATAKSLVAQLKK